MTASQGSARRAPCPRCQQPAVLAAENPHRPFCSERCRQIDFGGWIAARYVIEEPLLPTDPHQLADDET